VVDPHFGNCFDHLYALLLGQEIFGRFRVVHKAEQAIADICQELDDLSPSGKKNLQALARESRRHRL
jgi:hypothetical protein